ncbi:SKN1-domain-containing protein [Ceraceosorus guamensis]|uniref:SKN1-domain-containing protein n=1 Tax=Ceraceosorus guamensis TaxID=1522189 RepID=A0A316WB33_9BASI|nr:SKN1-domain-containing protein [Ceraceosorus guamensis]PWN44835.1 SKN1-domain-containing protein [Ceraceosorus guamensis]
MPLYSCVPAPFRSARTFCNFITLLCLIFGIMSLFLGYPLLDYFYGFHPSKHGGFNLGGTNASGQIPSYKSLGIREGLIDPDTDMKRHGQIQGSDGNMLKLVFSDEFNVDGRSFYPGDDPFWEALDLHPWGTGDFQWYDPSAVTTRDGALQITATEIENHNLNFRSGEIQSWNKLCYQGGLLEVGVRLPGSPQVSGWWPAVWTMGNLGIANYGATTEGLWPYAYNECDRGALINQTDADGLGPTAALESGAETDFNKIYKTKSLSYLPGMRLGRCTCEGEDHPGPEHPDGGWVARSAPEIDLYEAQVGWHPKRGELSLSGQFAPFNAGYWLGNESNVDFVPGDFVLSSYRGNIFQQAASGIAPANQDAYELTGGTYSRVSVEYKPGYESDGAFIEWKIDGHLGWRMNAAAVGPDERAGIAARNIAEEPQYIIMNLALSKGFGVIEFDQIKFPATMSVDYVRLYQDPKNIRVGCDPKDHPTKDYIERHMEAYTNANLTTWGNTRSVGGYGANWPRNKLYDGGKGCEAEPRNYPGNLRTGTAAHSSDGGDLPPAINGQQVAGPITNPVGPTHAGAAGPDPDVDTETTPVAEPGPATVTDDEDDGT